MPTPSSNLRARDVYHQHANGFDDWNRIVGRLKRLLYPTRRKLPTIDYSLDTVMGAAMPIHYAVTREDDFDDGFNELSTSDLDEHGMGDTRYDFLR